MEPRKRNVMTFMGNGVAVAMRHSKVQATTFRDLGVISGFRWFEVF